MRTIKEVIERSPMIKRRVEALWEEAYNRFPVEHVRRFAGPGNPYDKNSPERFQWLYERLGVTQATMNNMRNGKVSIVTATYLGFELCIRDKLTGEIESVETDVSCPVEPYLPMSQRSSSE